MPLRSRSQRKQTESFCSGPAADPSFCIQHHCCSKLGLSRLDLSTHPARAGLMTCAQVSGAIMSLPVIVLKKAGLKYILHVKLLIWFLPILLFPPRHSNTHRLHSARASLFFPFLCFAFILNQIINRIIRPFSPAHLLSSHTAGKGKKAKTAIIVNIWLGQSINIQVPEICVFTSCDKKEERADSLSVRTCTRAEEVE